MPASIGLRTFEVAPSTTGEELRSGQGEPRRTLLQLTDPHLFAKADGQLLGVTTRRSFEAVLEHACTHSPHADTLVLTGDLVHDESREGYRSLRRLLDRTGLPYYCIPGNHDSRPLMEDLLGPAALGPVAVHRLGNWNLVFLDSTEPGQDGGRIGGARLAALREALAASPSPAVIFLHQHPIPVQSDWMDRLSVADGDELIALCNRSPRVKALVCGHIHQEFEQRIDGYSVLGTPSTCVQFAPRRSEFAIDTRAPGYRELTLHQNGALETHVVRLDGYPERALRTARGY
ncbi:3',5'-cyclic-AMP phosphodiesterase [Thiocapsa marina]|uniref:Calcineurin phosphoesterase domain protein n=1 Tax=Thiocapsa marina 5811 TaxID=768671 RepID=F9UG46_9GAMM|nr:3',5'-cyclic-AMP phosphodiesterase [Thiocapsa marina]EGV16772.1 Calcineurin phosphoesterase domain protein [Thiocapsa marina 5811]